MSTPFELVSCRVVVVVVGWRTFSTSQPLCEALFRPVPVKKARSEERRVGKECRVWEWAEPLINKPRPAEVPCVSVVRSDWLRSYLKATEPVALAGVTEVKLVTKPATVMGMGSELWGGLLWTPFELVSCRVVVVVVGWRTFSTSQPLCEALFRPVPVKKA